MYTQYTLHTVQCTHWTHFSHCSHYTVHTVRLTIGYSNLQDWAYGQHQIRGNTTLEWNFLYLVSINICSCSWRANDMLNHSLYYAFLILQCSVFNSVGNSRLVCYNLSCILFWLYTINISNLVSFCLGCCSTFTVMYSSILWEFYVKCPRNKATFNGISSLILHYSNAFLSSKIFLIQQTL